MPRADGPTPRLTAVVCTYDRYDVLADAIAALARQDLPADEVEILVIDNSPDAARSAEMARDYAAIANLTWQHEPRPGLSNARNVALSRAAGQIIAYVDDDAVPVPGWAGAVLAAFDALGPQTAILGGRVVPLFRQARPEWLSDKLLDFLSMVDLGEERRLIGPGEWVVGANIAYRSAVLRQVGGFSTNLGRIGNAGLLSSEETDVANKIKALGFDTGYDPTAQVSHLVDASRTTQAWFARRIAWQAVSAVLSGESGAQVQLDQAAEEIRKYFAVLHPADRHAGALLVDQSDPSALNWQLGTIYNLLVVLLAGGRAVPPTAEAR
jgi:glucosyl-dolichyl phosphate glucuronosyltransferase